MRTVEAECQESLLVVVAVVAEHALDDGRHGSTHLPVRQFLRQPSAPCQQGKRLKRTGAVSDGTAIHGEGTFGRNESFQNHAVTLHTFLRTQEVAVGRIPDVMFSAVGEHFQAFNVHGMQHEAVVVVESEIGTVAVETVTHIPLFDLTQRRDNAISVARCTGLTQEALYRR